MALQRRVLDRGAPEKCAFVNRLASTDHRQQITTIEWIAGVSFSIPRSKHRGCPVHRDRCLLRYHTNRNHTRPTDDGRHSNAAFPQRKLLPSKRPVVGKALAAVVTRENHQRVASHTCLIQRSQNFSNTIIQTLHHCSVSFQRTAGGETEVARKILFDAVPRVASLRSLPWAKFIEPLRGFPNRRPLTALVPD